MINFNKFYKLFNLISLSLVIASVLLLFFKGLNFGVDFKGGTLIELRSNDKNINVTSLRQSFNKINLGDFNIKKFGNENDFLIKIEKKDTSTNAIEVIKKDLTSSLGSSFNFRRVENVGPKVSSELLKSGIIAIALSLAAMLFYIWIRFEWQFSLGAILALFHDVIITLGLFSLFSLEINLSIVAAVLTIVGYSMNDLPMNRDFKKGSLFHLASMDWHPNQEAVNWFLDKVWNEIQANFPLSKLYLAGRGMTKKLKNLDMNNVEIVGEVHSAKDFIVEHDIMIVPLLSGSGMRVKLIEGMALGKTIITTSIGAEGIDAENNKHLIIADTPEEFAAAITKCLNDTPFKESIGLEAQRLIASKYSNKSISSRMIYFFDQLIHASA